VEQGRGIFGEVAHAEGIECFRMHRIGDLIAVREGMRETDTAEIEGGREKERGPVDPGKQPMYQERGIVNG
jgi:hypothetical protein